MPFTLLSDFIPHILTVFLNKLHACVCLFHSLTLPIFFPCPNFEVYCPVETDYIWCNIQGQVTELCFFSPWELIFIYSPTLPCPITSGCSLGIYPLHDEMIFFFFYWTPLRFVVPPGNRFWTCPPFRSLRISENTSLVLPVFFFPRSLQGFH